jgi:hypothetical protein
VERCVSKRIDYDESHALSGVEQRGRGTGRMMIYRCRAEELSGIVVALTLGWTRSVH